MNPSPEPGLLDCMAMIQTDHKTKLTRLFCMKHGTVILEAQDATGEPWSNRTLLPLWRARSCKDLP